MSTLSVETEPLFEDMSAFEQQVTDTALEEAADRQKTPFEVYLDGQREYQAVMSAHYRMRSRWQPETATPVETTSLRFQVAPEGQSSVVYAAKAEYEQPVRAFKLRGAYNACMRQLEESPSTRTFVANSAGNHGQGVAYFVRWYNETVLKPGEQPMQAVIFCAEDASPQKVGGMEALGAIVVREGIASLEEAGMLGLDFVKSQNLQADGTPAYFVRPFDDPDVMAGQSTILTETMQQLDAAGYNLKAVPLVLRVAGGGFGLACGVGALMQQLVREGRLHPDSHVVATQMEYCDSMKRALARLSEGVTSLDHLFDPEDPNDFDPSADGTAVRKVGERNLPLAYWLQEQGRLRVMGAEKASVGRAMAEAWVRGYQLEPAGALAAAGRLEDERHLSLAAAYGSKVAPYVDVVVESGGNCSEATRDEFARAYTDRRREPLRVMLGLHAMAA